MVFDGLVYIGRMGLFLRREWFACAVKLHFGVLGCSSYAYEYCTFPKFLSFACVSCDHDYETVIVDLYSEAQDLLECPTELSNSKEST